MLFQSIVWLMVLATGLLVAIVSSRIAVRHLTAFSAGTRIPPFVVGITLVSLGTDLPEIASSVMAALTGHGDINVGNAIGSTTVQTTLILGILPFAAGVCPVDRGRVGRIGAVTVAALLGGALLMSDGSLGRLDATLLLAGWVAGTVYVWRLDPEGAAGAIGSENATGSGLRHFAGALAALVAVGLGATTAVEGLTNLASLWSLPEYMVAFTLASVGTSLPELVVEVTAARKGQWQLAVGDALGSSFVDSTLSLAAGPLIRPITVSTQLAVVGSLVAAGACGLAVVILAARKAHDWRSGLGLIIIFVLVYLLLGNLGW